MKLIQTTMIAIVLMVLGVRAEGAGALTSDDNGQTVIDTVTTATYGTTTVKWLADANFAASLKPDSPYEVAGDAIPHTKRCPPIPRDWQDNDNDDDDLGCGGGGTGTPNASLSPRNGLTFTSQNIDSVSSVQTATLTNTGNASLSIVGISASGDFKESNNCPSSLAPKANCVIQVTFTPSVTGARTGTLTVSDNAASSSQSLSLSGTGGAALFYVATNGKDSWTGTLPAPNACHTDGPFATLDHARLVVQGVNKTGLNQVTVQIRAGTYFQPLPPPPPLGQRAQTSSLLFTSFDSGTPTTEIIYENFPGESPVISGGMRVTNWTNTSGNIWTATLPSTTLNFENLFYNGARRLRPRLAPGATTPQQAYLGTYLRVVNPVILTSAPTTQLDMNNCPNIAPGQWECFDRFTYNQNDPISSTWQNLSPQLSNPCGQAPGNPSLWGDIELLDFEQFTASKLRIGCIDTVNSIVYLTGPTHTNSGRNGFIQGHRYLIENVKDELSQPGQWFLDRSATPWTLTYLASPGEDPNTDTVIIPQSQQVMVAYGLQYVTFQGLTFTHDNFTVPGGGYQSGDLDAFLPAAVSFQDAQNLILDSDTVTQTGGAGMEFLSCGERNAPSWCFIPPPGSSIPVPPDITANNVVQDSAFYDLGGTGIHIGMPQDAGSDSDMTIPHSMIVQNTVIEGWGRVFPSAFGIGQGIGYNNTYTQNDVYEGYNVAISICVCGNALPQHNAGTHDNTISFNHVHDTHQGIMNDGGAVRIGDGNGVYAGTNNQILNNKVHDVSSASVMDGSNSDPTCPPPTAPWLPCDGYGGNGIYLDNQSGSITVKNNLVYRVSEYAVNFPMTPYTTGIENHIENNILAYARASMINVTNPFPTFDPTQPPTPPNLVFSAKYNIFYFDRNENSAQYPFYIQGGCTYTAGAPYTSYQQWSNNVYYRTDGSFGSDTNAFHIQTVQSSFKATPCTGDTSKWQPYSLLCPNPVLGGLCWQGNGANEPAEDVNSVVLNPWASNPTGPANDDYSSPVVPPSIGFVVFDPSQAGRSNPVIQPPAIPATFPTQKYTDF